jgi:hypothetical protein
MPHQRRPQGGRAQRGETALAFSQSGELGLPDGRGQGLSGHRVIRKRRLRPPPRRHAKIPLRFSPRGLLIRLERHALLCREAVRVPCGSASATHPTCWLGLWRGMAPPSHKASQLLAPPLPQLPQLPTKAIFAKEILSPYLPYFKRPEIPTLSIPNDESLRSDGMIKGAAHWP